MANNIDLHIVDKINIVEEKKEPAGVSKRPKGVFRSNVRWDFCLAPFTQISPLDPKQPMEKLFVSCKTTSKGHTDRAKRLTRSQPPTELRTHQELWFFLLLPSQSLTFSASSLLYLWSPWISTNILLGLKRLPLARMRLHVNLFAVAPTSGLASCLITWLHSLVQNHVLVFN